MSSLGPVPALIISQQEITAIVLEQPDVIWRMRSAIFLFTGGKYLSPIVPTYFAVLYNTGTSIKAANSYRSEMVLKVLPDKSSLSKMAAEHAAEAIVRAICDRGQARIIAATAASQFEFLDALTKMPGIDWQKVEVFHLDAYIGLRITHPGSFRKMLLDHLIKKTGIAKYHLLDGDADPAEVVRRVGKELTSAPIDVAFVGIGETGHLAFNDPPADFQTEEPYLIVNLDEACRQQQAGEAGFSDISQVPKQSVSMSVRQILNAEEILALVPNSRKAQVERACFDGESTPMA